MRENEPRFESVTKIINDIKPILQDSFERNTAHLNNGETLDCIVSVVVTIIGGFMNGLDQNLKDGLSNSIALHTIDNFNSVAHGRDIAEKITH